MFTALSSFINVKYVVYAALLIILVSPIVYLLYKNSSLSSDNVDLKLEVTSLKEANFNLEVSVRDLTINNSRLKSGLIMCADNKRSLETKLEEAMNSCEKLCKDRVTSEKSKCSEDIKGFTQKLKNCKDTRCTNCDNCSANTVAECEARIAEILRGN